LAANGAGSGPVLVGYGVTEASTRRRPRLPAADPHGTMRVEAGPPGEAVKPVRHGGLEVGRAAERALAEQGATVAEPAARVRAKPLVRKLARELGVDLAAVAASGPHGTVTRDDVRLAAEGLSVTPDVTAWPEGGVPASSVAVAAGEPGESEVREPVRGVRRLMAEAMTASAFSVPHVTEWVEVDVTRSIELLERMRRLPAYEGIRLSPLLLVARALIEAVRRTPIANSFFDAEAGEAGEVVVRRHVNLGIAAATPRGLVVPNVKGAQALALPDLARALNALVETAKAGRTTPADMSGGTITITNVGVFGVDGGTPIINPGEAAILCMGAVRLKPWVVGGHVVPRQVMELTLSFDHRHIDGAAGSIVLADVARLLEEPALYSV
jgi:pyruvate dehydrogenase E2 component (dihydrolipoamide acetyltransferase)